MIAVKGSIKKLNDREIPEKVSHVYLVTPPIFPSGVSLTAAMIDKDRKKQIATEPIVIQPAAKA